MAREMNHWRSFFAGSDTDIWTAIEMAIVLAATDYPEEFKNRRSDIAETLFSPTLLRLSSHGADATRLSRSGISNAENLEENAVGDDRDEAEDARDGFTTPLNPIHNNEETLGGHMVEKTAAVKELYLIKGMLQHSDQSEKSLLEVLQRLQNLHVTVEALKETEIGRPVNMLRKHHSKQVRSIVKMLVSAWKDLVDEWVRTAGDDAAAAIAGNGALALTAKEEGRFSLLSFVEDGLLAANTTSVEINQSISHTDKETGFAGYQESCQKDGGFVYPMDHVIRSHSYISMKPQLRSTQTFFAKTEFASDRDFNGQGLKSAEERASSNVDYSCPNKIERSESDSRHSCHNGSTLLGIEHKGRLSTAGLHCHGPGRPASESTRTKLYVNSDLEVEYGKNWKPPANRPTFTEDIQTAEKVELVKRKLHEGCQQAENAKKQRVAQCLGILDIPKA